MGSRVSDSRKMNAFEFEVLFRFRGTEPATQLVDCDRQKPSLDKGPCLPARFPCRLYSNLAQRRRFLPLLYSVQATLWLRMACIGGEPSRWGMYAIRRRSCILFVPPGFWPRSPRGLDVTTQVSVVVVTMSGSSTFQTAQCPHYRHLRDPHHDTSDTTPDLNCFNTTCNKPQCTYVHGKTIRRPRPAFHTPKSRTTYFHIRGILALRLSESYCRMNAGQHRFEVQVHIP